MILNFKIQHYIDVDFLIMKKTQYMNVDFQEKKSTSIRKLTPWTMVLIFFLMKTKSAPI